MIVVILDAARASHFSAYGYERDTTSHIDRLAAEGMVFRNAFSECPSTVCSIPNLISGIPFLDLGADERGRLNGAIVTLAEYLAARGYRTIGVSANMHNSRSRNSDQGFDQFIEMWEREGGEFDPHLLSERAIEALRAVELEEPVFLQLHYLPPHEPYAPGPEFDVFGDSDYRGFVRPGMALEIRSAYGPTGDPAEAGSVRAVRDGQRTLPPADLQEMLALYDGNLRKADDAVGRLFDALRDQGRWENSIILVTSDHGEAFFEHGYQGHNTTLYREMLHVPFILRVPNRDAANRADTDRLVVLSDVVPTILGRLGIKPAPEVGGMDLLATRDDRPRAIFHRMGQRLLSTRTRRWNAIFTRVWDEPMLFDLVADPGELENVAERYPLVHHGLAALLNQHLSEVESRGGLASQEAEIPEEELEALRALGYVQ